MSGLTMSEFEHISWLVRFAQRIQVPISTVTNFQRIKFAEGQEPW